MSPPVAVHPLVSPWGRFGLYSFYLDAPEPAIVDTGIATSPAEGMAPALARIGRRIEDVRWILLTHGHVDHVGGAHALWELTGRRARVVVHEADAHLVRSRQAHVDAYLQVRDRYLRDPHGMAQQTEQARSAISGELEPHVLVRGGETLSLGGGARVRVHAIPGHTPGSVAYEVEGQGELFVGDAVQIHGAANGFPGYEDPDAYRASLLRLRDEVRPRRLYLGHPYRSADGVAHDVVLPEDQARRALQDSLDLEARVRDAAHRQLGTGPGPQVSDSPYSPFAAVAAELGYQGDPRLEPSPFFTTLHGYASRTTHHDEELTARAH
jgi:glyoxylase-like metal-dependent hydrolase (beta-lactamase superfamily II)